MLISHFDICTRFSDWFRCHHQLVQRLDSEVSLDLRAHCSAILVSRLLSIVHIVGFCGLHFSVQVDIENVVSEINWNKIVLSIPDHQFLEVVSHSLTNFSVNRDHVSIVVSQVEILSSHASNLCSTTQHLVYASESSVQRSKRPVFVVSFELPSSTIRNPFTTGCSMESSVSCSIWTKVQRACVHCSSCVQVHLHPCKPFRTAHDTKIKTSK